MKLDVRLWIAVVSLLFCLNAYATNLRLCGGPQVREGHVEARRFITTWHWRAEESAGLPDNLVPHFENVDDCKPSADGKELLVSSSSGAIAVVAYPTGKTLFYAAVPNAHSIEALPDGVIAAASSTHPKGNRVLFFIRSAPDRPVASIPLEAAHGVVYDPVHKVLWALGDKYLLRLVVRRTGATTVDVREDHRYPLGFNGGHDLSLSHDAAKLFITASPQVVVFDIAHETFGPYERLSGLKNVKSMSIDPVTGQLAYTQADPRVWWTYILHFQNPESAATLDAPTYKVRWAAR